MKLRKKKLIILGFGGHARSVADVALRAGYIEILFIDPNARQRENFLGYPVKKSWENVDFPQWDVIPAVGDNSRRSQQFLNIESFGLCPASLISPLASVGAGSVIAPGSFVGHHAHIGPMAKIGRGCIINTGAIVEHESRIGDFSHVAVNATIAGRSQLGDFCMLGAGATIIDQISIANDVTIGAGGLANRSIVHSGIYVGVPIRKLTQRS